MPLARPALGGSEQANIALKPDGPTRKLIFLLAIFMAALFRVDVSLCI